MVLALNMEVNILWQKVSDLTYGLFVYIHAILMLLIQMLLGVLEKAAEHKIGRGLERELAPAENFASEIGSGIKCIIKGRTIHIGKPSFYFMNLFISGMPLEIYILMFHVHHIIGNRRCLTTNGIDVSPGTLECMEVLEKRGQTSIVLSVDGRSEAVLGLIDKARDDALRVVQALRYGMGVKVFMLTGDNERTAKVIARKIGIDPRNVVSDVLPEGKVACIKKLQEMGECVAMIGDGVNDSPAMAQADVGLAIGAGTDVAIETAGIVLMNSKLCDVVVAIDFSRKVMTRIKLNFVWALGYNTLAIPIAAGTLYPVIQMALPPFMAGKSFALTFPTNQNMTIFSLTYHFPAIAMILSSLSVLISSLLLNTYKPPDIEKEYMSKVTVEAEEEFNEIKREFQCSSMKNGTTCCCSPSDCGCSGCEHNSTERGGHVPFYPGCGQLWDSTCSCLKPCTCSSACGGSSKFKTS